MLTDLERKLLAFGTQGDGAVLGGLRKQVDHVVVSTRDFTGTGFFTELTLPDESLRVGAVSFEISDIEGSAAELEHGFGCTLFVKDGQLDTIEVFTYAESWPNQVSMLELYHANPLKRNFDAVLETGPPPPGCQ